LRGRRARPPLAAARLFIFRWPPHSRRNHHNHPCSLQRSELILCTDSQAHKPRTVFFPPPFAAALFPVHRPYPFYLTLNYFPTFTHAVLLLFHTFIVLVSFSRRLSALFALSQTKPRGPCARASASVRRRRCVLVMRDLADCLCPSLSVSCRRIGGRLQSTATTDR